MLSDLRLTLRTLAKSPAFVAVAVFTLTLGIGVNAAMFGLVNAILLRGLPLPESWRVVHLASQRLKENDSHMGLSYADFADLRGQQRSCEDLAAYRGAQTVNLSSPGQDPERVLCCLINASGPAMLRVAPALGRWFRAEEDQPGVPPVIVLGFAIWQNRFKADPAVLGQPVKVNGEWATVIGIGPPDFRFPEVSDAWMPLRFSKLDETRDSRYLDVLGRLRDGVTLAQAGTEFSGLAQRLALAHADTNKDVGALVRPLHDEFVGEDMRRLVSIMFGAVLLVLLIACANIANLQLARAAVRQKEIAVRAALGASRGRVVRLLLTESLVLASGGALLGLPLAHWLLVLLNDYIKVRTIPYWMVFDLDWAGLGFIVGATLFATLAAGLWPAWLATRADLNTVLKDSSRGSTGFSLSRFTRALVIGEVVLSSVLLVLSGLTIRSVIKMQTAPLGFATAGVFTGRVALNGDAYKKPPKQHQFYHDLLERLAARREVAGAAIADLQPTWDDRTQVEFDGRPRGGPQGSGLPAQFASRAAVSGNYFAVLGIKLAQGRTFDDRDTATAPKVAVVSTRFAERNWPGESALGQHFVYGWGLDVKPEDWITIVGVVAPTLQGEFNNGGNSVTTQTYVPYPQRDDVRYMTMFVKGRGGDAAALAPLVRQTVRSLDDDLPVFRPMTLDGMVDQTKFFKRLFAWIFGLFGSVALVLAGVGLYGVMSYSVSQRTQEIGVRMALGAEPRDVIVMILREGGLRLGLGMAIGLTAAFFAGRLLAFVLWGVTPADPATFAATIAALGAAGLVACLLPALRAVRVNPVEALRCE